jgi:hypothetical protein
MAGEDARDDRNAARARTWGGRVNSNKTQCDRVRGYLETHGAITPMEALNEIGTMRLAARIAELRAAGMPIETCREEVKTRAGTAVVARYVLMRAPKLMPTEQIGMLA